MTKPNIVVRLSAAHWDATVRTPNGPVNFNFRKMLPKERSTFHRELMNAFRASLKT